METSFDDSDPKSVITLPTAISMRRPRLRTGWLLASSARTVTCDVLWPSCGSRSGLTEICSVVPSSDGPEGAGGSVLLVVHAPSARSRVVSAVKREMEAMNVSVRCRATRYCDSSSLLSLPTRTRGSAQSAKFTLIEPETATSLPV